MEKNQNRSLFQRFQVIVAALLLMAAMGLATGEGSAAVIHIGSDGISVEAEVGGVTSLELRVAGPDGFHDVRQSATGALEWYPSTMLPDGEYRFEVFVTAGDEPEEAESSEEADDDNSLLYYENSRFEVEGGVLSPLEDAVPPLAPDEQSSVQSRFWLSRIAQGVWDFLVPSAHAADLTASSTVPKVYFYDTSVVGNDWYLMGTTSTFQLYDDNFGKQPFYTENDTNFTVWLYDDRFRLHNFKSFGDSIYLDDDCGLNVLYADSLGDITLANGAVFIDKSSTNMGIGTITPTEDLHIVDGTPGILLDDTSGGDIRISQSSGELSFFVSNGTYNGAILTFENDLSTSLYPGLGIWESNPIAPLHVESHDGMSGKIIVKNPTAPTAVGDVTMFSLQNAGTKTVRFEISAGGDGDTWTFDNLALYNTGSGINSGLFRITKRGTGVSEFTVDGFGNGTFYGNSYATNHVNTSARAAKTDFQELNEREILAKVMQLPVSQWRYKQEGPEARHIGPVAEDFQEVFGLGDGKHISTVDADGVALAAIKAIKAEKDAEIVALKEDNRVLLERLNALEELVLGRQKVTQLMQ